MHALARGEMPASDPGLQEHLDRCLGCRGCETVCPSGVIFGPALEASRALIARVRPLPFPLRAALWILARPGRQRLAWFLSRMLRATGLPAWLARGAGMDAPLLARMMAMLAATKPTGGRYGGTAVRAPSARGAAAGPQFPARTAVPPYRRPAVPPDRRPALLFRGCVMNGLFRHVHDATIAALAHNECEVTEVPGQVCCGALAAHAGAHDLAQRLARENVAAFAHTGGPIVVNSAGCGAMLRGYGAILAGDPLEDEALRVAARVRDVSELLAEQGPRPGTRAIPLRVAYDAPCHLIHAQQIVAPPLRLLAAVPGLTVVPLEGAERCCGSAGLYSMIEPGMSREVLAAKLAAIGRAAPDLVATGNPGCLMQIGGGTLLDDMGIGVVHPVELLAWSYRA